MPEGPLFSLEERTSRILAALADNHCLAAFFCVGNNCEKENENPCMEAINEQGHFLANHSLSHRHLSRLSLVEFEEEIVGMDALLNPFPQSRKWFRFPYLDYGNRSSIGGSPEKTKEAFSLLHRLGFKEAYVTINTFDWYLNSRLNKAIKVKQNIDYAALKTVYLSLLETWCRYYIELYETHCNGEIPHTLLLHANDLTALYLDDILKLIQSNGWELISPEAAFKDVSWRYQILPQKLYLITEKPPSLDCLEIDKRLGRAGVFS